MQFGAFCQSKKSIKFSFRLTNLLLLQRLLKIFNHGQCGLIHIVLSKKKKEKDRTAFNLRFTYQKFYPETIYTLKYFIQNSTKSTIHFFLYLHHFRKIESQYWFTHKKRKVNFFQKHVWFELRCIF